MLDDPFSGQYYKHFTIVNYDSRVVTWAMFKSYDYRVVNYDRKVLYKIDSWLPRHFYSAENKLQWLHKGALYLVDGAEQ